MRRRGRPGPTAGSPLVLFISRRGQVNPGLERGREIDRPLAGKTLHFTITVRAVRGARDAERETRQVESREG